MATEAYSYGDQSEEVYLVQIIIITQCFKLMMESQIVLSNPIGQWVDDIAEKGNFRKKIYFLALNRDFQFRVVLKRNIAMSLVMAQGHLVFNNGLSVPIISAHQALFNQVLNPTNSRVMFAIDLPSQTLTFTAKILAISDSLAITSWVGEVEKEVFSKKKVIETLLGVVGIQMDSQHHLMKQLLKAKNGLKTRIEKILDSAGSVVNAGSEGGIEAEGSAVVVFGEGTNIKMTAKGSERGRKEGGYFEIVQQEYLIEDKVTNSSQIKCLCKKILKTKRMQQQNSQNWLKIKKELIIVDSIKDQRFLIKYYYQGNMDNLSEVLMEKVDYNLQEYVYYYGDALQLTNKIKIAKKVVEAVMVLHQNGVVHRDIKPSNILIEDRIDDPVIKIIDFAESYSSKVSLEVQEYASSFPYSPLECNERENIKPEGSRKGIVNPEIDYWSVGMTIYEIFFRKLPVSFSKTFLSDIISSWKSQLLLAVNQRQKIGLAVIDQIITIICVKMIKLEQKERMNLKMAYALLVELERYVDDLMQIIHKNK